ATPKAGIEFELATDRTGARAARAERWVETGFAGSWLVFRLVFADRGVEIDIPVVSGRQSEALYWIPVSWRPDTLPPAPPPVDAAARFGIRWAPLTKAAKTHQPWTEGYLTTPGLRVELPKNWWPVVTLRSENGFPVRIIDLDGNTRGWVVRLDAGDPTLEPSEDSGWAPIGRPKRYQAVRAYLREDGARLYVAREGHGFAIRPEPGAETEITQWELLVDSVSLRRP
ncbi:MAG: hypothetical protein R3344_04305, partial [Acidobacteriota bacterium]|nr:hypothetical protein [Acidobacteriota bacterium]